MLHACHLPYLPPLVVLLPYGRTRPRPLQVCSLYSASIRQSCSLAAGDSFWLAFYRHLDFHSVVPVRRRCSYISCLAFLLSLVIQNHTSIVLFERRAPSSFKNLAPFSSSPDIIKPQNLKATLTPVTMCYRLVERFSVCRCVYYKHNIDMCAAANQQGHAIQEKTILVGYLCGVHSDSDSHQSRSSPTGFPDSGYASRDSHHRSPRHDRR